MRHSRPILTAFLLAALLVGIGGCRQKTDKPEPQKASGPAAEVRQRIATPTLAPQPTETPLSPEEPAADMPPPEETTAAGRAEPSGPITLPPAAETKVPPEAETTTEATTPETPPAEAEPSEPEALDAGLATLSPEKAEPAATEEGQGMQALAVPSLAPAEAPPPPEAQAVAYQPKLVTAQTNVDILLDASGSMAAPFSATTNQSKFDLLLESFYDVVAEMSAQQKDFPRNIAVRLFGSETPAADDNCRDTQLLLSMGEPDLGGIQKTLSSIAPQGKSPIALTLTEAATDFPTGTEADRVIVLVADGADNCEGDPCEATRKLEAQAIKTIVHVIAFDVNPADHEKLECIAKEGDGKFFLARNEGELRQALAESINSTLPYNFKLVARAGASPIPFNLVVYKAGSQRVERRDTSTGTKLISLPPGTYDILIEYAESEESKRPSKILKGVEIVKTTKVEQEIAFSLGSLTLSAVDNAGKLAPTRYTITATGKSAPVAVVETGADAKTFLFTPGTYDIQAERIGAGPDEFSLTEKDVAINADQTIERTFRFQKGTLALKGMTTQQEAFPFVFQIYLANRTDMLVASSALPPEGGSVPLAPGKYDLLAIGDDPKSAASPRTKVSGIEIAAAGTTEVTVSFEMGVITLSAVDGQGNKIPAEFTLRDQKSQLEIGRLSSANGEPIKGMVPPGTYDIVAASLKSKLEPRPSVPVSGVVLTADKPLEQVITFILGTLRLRGSDAKERPIPTQFTVYKAASDEVVSKAPSSIDWTVFDLAPGVYDALSTNFASTDDPKPMVWLRDIKVEDGKTVSHEAIFTAGKLKIIGRGPNNQIILCHFKMYKYGADRELINGVTGQDWEIFEIEPGPYYLEASYHDEAQSVLLKKWVNITIGENEVVETVLRF